MNARFALSGWVGYALAVAAVAVATGVRLAFDPVLGDNYPFSTYFGAVAVVAWWVRTGPSVAALLLSAVVSLYIFLPPRYSVVVKDPGVLAGLFLFVAVGVVMVAMGHARRAALARAARSLAEAVAGRDEARRAADAEAEQRERLRTTLAGIGDAVISTDRDGNVTYLNPVAEALTGWTAAEAAGEPLTRVFHIVNESTRQPVENPAVRALTEGGVVGLANHTVLISKDGTERPIDDSAAPIRCKAGEVVGSVLVFRDITARRHAERERERGEAAVRASETRFRLAADAVNGIIYECDLRTGRVERSRGLYEVLGHHPDEVPPTQAWWAEQIHPDDRDRVLRPDPAVVRPSTSPVEYRVRHRDGRWLFVEDRGVVVRDDGGAPVRLIGCTTDVTERKEAERAIRAGEEKYRTLFESMDEGFCVIEFFDGPHGPLSDYVHVEANPAYTANAGIPNIVGQKVRELVPDEADGWVQIYRDVLLTGRPVRFERELVATGRYLDLAAFRIGPVERRQVAVLFKDVTPRKRAEAQLRESEERLRLALDAAGMGTWEWTVGTNEIKWEQKTRELFGVDADTPVSYALFESRLHPDDVEPNRRKTDESLRTGEYENEFRVPLPGGVRWVATRGQMLRDGAGRNVRMLGVVADVTRRKASEEERAAAERTFATLVELCPFGIYIVDADFRIAHVNVGSQTGAFANVRPLIGRSFEEAIRILWPEPVAADIITKFRHTLATGEPYRSTDFVNPRADTAQTEGYEWELHRLALPGGRYGVVCYYYDSTRLRQVEQALRDADRRKDVFLATLAHELRNPLAPIRNGLQVIRLAGAGGAVEQARSMMDRQLTQLVRLVDDLLDISRVTSGKLELRRERVALRAVIDAAVETSRPAVEQAGHALAVTVADEPVLVDGDLTRLAQVVSNLLTNSAKYTHRGGHITLTARRDGAAAVVSVADDGIGIPPAMLDQVFQMFVQVDRTLEKTTGGLGIGLSLVRGLVEMHGGTVEARSAGEGKGSEFVVRLPVVDAGAGAADRGDERVEGARPSDRRRILVVDDNEDAADSLAQLLELLGNEVRTANDGAAGVAAAAAFRPAVVLCDIGMPKVNGYEAARRIRAEPWGRGMVLVALTGWGQEDDRRKTAEAGFDHHLVKPVEFAALTKLLADLRPAPG